MQDYNVLRARVEEVSRKLMEAHSRRSQSELSLIDILRRLGGNITAQQSLLKDYQAQIGALAEEKPHPGQVAGRQPLEADDARSSLETATTDNTESPDGMFLFPWETSPEEP